MHTKQNTCTYEKCTCTYLKKTCLQMVVNCCRCVTVTLNLLTGFECSLMVPYIKSISMMSTVGCEDVCVSCSD